MSIDVTGKNCKLWINEHKKQNGDVWHTYTIGVSKKDQNGQYVNAYQDVQFTKNVDPTRIPNGTTFDFEGWLSVKVYRDKDGKEVRRPIIMINKANFQYDPKAAAESYQDSFEGLDEDVPFN